VTAILSIVGARPQFIKAATISRALRNAKAIRQILVHTGQHYDDNMSAVFFRELEIPEPKFDLGVGSGPHGAQTARMLEEIESVLLDQTPDWVVVYGDTNSTLAGALAAAKLHVPVAHVEAGLRSFNRAMPEEINRIVADHVCDLLFAPTDGALSQLQREGVPPSRIRLCGDVMYDAALHYGDKAEAQSEILAALGLTHRGYVLATVHRAENTDSPKRLAAVFDALTVIARELPVVVPLHPRTRKALAGQVVEPRLRFIEPVSYLDMTMLEKHARLIATDSGGVQKEAFFHGVPCATLRTETEWVELVDAGWNVVVPPSSADNILTGLRSALANSPPDRRPSLYGDGTAAQQIVRALLDAHCGDAS
jgi:UDP-GlcNAc3NAcA epimerase